LFLSKKVVNSKQACYNTYSFLIHSNYTSKSSLKSDTSNSHTQHSKCPGVCELFNLGPKAVLLLAVFLELLSLDGIMLGISLSLALLVLLVATEIAQEDVVSDGAESSDGMEKSGTNEKDGERSVDKRIAKVADDC
jgi:hypothetical protein